VTNPFVNLVHGEGVGGGWVCFCVGGWGFFCGVGGLGGGGGGAGVVGGHAGLFCIVSAKIADPLRAGRAFKRLQLDWMHFFPLYPCRSLVKLSETH